MVLNLDNDFYIDMDKVSAVSPRDKHIVVDGSWLTIERDDHIKVIAKAFAWKHKSYMYDKNLKKIR